MARRGTVLLITLVFVLVLSSSVQAAELIISGQTVPQGDACQVVIDEGSSSRTGYVAESELVSCTPGSIGIDNIDPQKTSSFFGPVRHPLTVDTVSGGLDPNKYFVLNQLVGMNLIRNGFNSIDKSQVNNGADYLKCLVGGNPCKITIHEAIVCGEEIEYSMDFLTNSISGIAKYELDDYNNIGSSVCTSGAAGSMGGINREQVLVRNWAYTLPLNFSCQYYEVQILGNEEASQWMTPGLKSMTKNGNDWIYSWPNSAGRGSCTSNCYSNNGGEIKLTESNGVLTKITTYMDDDGTGNEGGFNYRVYCVNPTFNTAPSDADQNQTLCTQQGFDWLPTLLGGPANTPFVNNCCGDDDPADWSSVYFHNLTNSYSCVQPGQWVAGANFSCPAQALSNGSLCVRQVPASLCTGEVLQLYDNCTRQDIEYLAREFDWQEAVGVCSPVTVLGHQYMDTDAGSGSRITGAEDLDCDSYGNLCTWGSDCDDTDPLVNVLINCNYDGNQCGNFQLCIQDQTFCPVQPNTESRCSDGFDGDCDGQTDCADSDCAGVGSCAPAAASCGDGTCNGAETCATCPSDCTTGCSTGTCDAYCKGITTSSYSGGYCYSGPSLCPGANEVDEGSPPSVSCSGTCCCQQGSSGSCNVDGSCSASECGIGCSDCDADGDGSEKAVCGLPGDCDDGNPLRKPGNTEFCSDGIDNDCNGLIDTADPACSSCMAGPELCGDGCDNDGNGLVDNADCACSGCGFGRTCQPSGVCLAGQYNYNYELPTDVQEAVTPNIYNLPASGLASHSPTTILQGPGGSCTCVAGVIQSPDFCSSGFSPDCDNQNPNVCNCRSLSAGGGSGGSNQGSGGSAPTPPIPYWAECKASDPAIIWLNKESPAEYTGGINYNHPDIAGGGNISDGLLVCGGSTTYYCANDGATGGANWTTNLDFINYAGACGDYGYTWTGNYCCSELDDSGFPETYSDFGGFGGCFQSTYQTNDKFLQTTGTNLNQQNSSEPGVEPGVIVLNGEFIGCALDGNWNTQNDALLALTSYPDPGGIGSPGGPLINNLPHCTYINITTVPHYCSYAEEWRPQTEDRSVLSAPPFPVGPGNLPAECCGQTTCWNGTTCIADQSSDPTSPPQQGFRCIAGNWNPAIVKWTPDGRQSGYCPSSNQCLLSLTTNGCVNDSFYAGDDYCRGGAWTSRTRLVADKLLQLVGPNDFRLFCDDKAATLVNPSNSGSPVKYCALWLDPIGSPQVYLGVALGNAPTPNEIDNYIKDVEQAYISAFNGTRPPPAPWGHSCSNLTTNFQRCAQVQYASGRFMNVYYDAPTQIIIMSASASQSAIQGGLVSIILNFLNSIINIGQPRVALLEDFNKLYITRKGAKTVKAIEELVPDPLTPEPRNLDTVLTVEYNGPNVNVNEINSTIIAQSSRIIGSTIIFTNPDPAAWQVVSGRTRLR